MKLYGLFRNGKAQAVASGGIAGGIGAVKAFEDLALVFGINRRTLIFYSEYAVAFSLFFKLYPGGSALARIFAGIV